MVSIILITFILISSLLLFLLLPRCLLSFGSKVTLLFALESFYSVLSEDITCCDQNAKFDQNQLKPTQTTDLSSNPGIQRHHDAAKDKRQQQRKPHRMLHKWIDARWTLAFFRCSLNASLGTVCRI